MYELLSYKMLSSASPNMPNNSWSNQTKECFTEIWAHIILGESSNS